MINQKNVKYEIDKEKRTVKCFLYDSSWLFIDFLSNSQYGKNFSYTPELINKLLMRSTFWGISYQSEEDEWDEERGKLLAYHRMREKVSKSMRKRMKIFKEHVDKKEFLFEEEFLNYMTKVDKTANRRLEIIKTFCEDK